MLYSAYRKAIRTAHVCPFCNLGNRIIISSRNACLTYSIAPYAKYHLLIIPTRHIETMAELKIQEWLDIFELLRVALKLFTAKKIRQYSLLVRIGKKIGRSIEHLHWNLIPNCKIGNIAKGTLDRRILTESERNRLIKEAQGLIERSGGRPTESRTRR